MFCPWKCLEVLVRKRARKNQQHCAAKLQSLHHRRRRCSRMLQHSTWSVSYCGRNCGPIPNARKSSERRCGPLQQSVALFEGSPRQKEKLLKPFLSKIECNMLVEGGKQNMLKAEAQALPHATTMLRAPGSGDQKPPSAMPEASERDALCASSFRVNRAV